MTADEEARIGFDTFNKTFKRVRDSLEDVYMIELEMQRPRTERIEQIRFALATLEFFDTIFSDEYDMAMNDYNVKEYGEQELG